MLKRARSKRTTKETLVEKNPAREKREMFVGGDPSNCYTGRSTVRRLFEEGREGGMWIHVECLFFFFFTTEFAKPYNLATWQVDPCEGEDK